MSIIPALKFCYACKLEKPIGAFPVRPGRTDLASRCLPCTESFEAASAERDALVTNGMRKCRNCNGIKPLSDFPVRRGLGRAANATTSRCKPCTAQASKDHYYASQDTNARRAAEAAAGLAAKGNATRPCAQCKQDLPLIQFTKDRRAIDGFKRICRACGALNSRNRRANVLNPSEESARLRDHNLQKYGINSAVFDVMSKAQNHECAVCHAHKESVAETFGFHVDHDHETGMVRALLCRSCNIALGAAKDSVDRLMELAAYLEYFKTEKTPAHRAGAAAWGAYYAAKKQ